MMDASTGTDYGKVIRNHGPLFLFFSSPFLGTEKTIPKYQPKNSETTYKYFPQLKDALG